MVRPCSENGRRKITHNSIEMDAETKESTSKTEEKLNESIRKAMNERNLNEGQWEDRKHGVWVLDNVVKRFETDIYIYIYIYLDIYKKDLKKKKKKTALSTIFQITRAQHECHTLLCQRSK
jgi:hypothetical protein